MNLPSFTHVVAAIDDHPEKGFTSISDWSVFDGLVMSVSFNDKGTHRTCGSAVMVAPGIAMTAKHVIKDELEKYINSSHRIICDALTTTRSYHFYVDQTVDIENTDLTLLCLALDNDFDPACDIKLGVITTRTPDIGEQILIIGCIADSAIFPMNGDLIEYSAKINISYGRVTQRYHSGRDRCMIPWPCIEVNGVSFGGMSGGPAFDMGGRLIGVLCSSVNESAAEGASYVSLLWPCLTSKFFHRWLPQYYKADEPICLLNLGDSLCRIEGRQAIKSTIDEQNPEMQLISFLLWP